MTILRTLLAGSLGLLLLAVPADVQAFCISSARCVCHLGTTLLDTRVESVEGATTKVRIEAVHGETGGFETSASLIVPRAGEDTAGSRLLVGVSLGEFSSLVRIGADGVFPCPLQANPDFALSADEAIDLALRPECRTDLYARGFEEPPCNDVVIGPFGCSTAAGAPLLVPLLAVFGWIWRKSPARR